MQNDREEETAENHIQRLYIERGRCDLNATTLTNTLESNIETVFSSLNKFIYELIQNADDSNASEVNFLLHNSNLLIFHNGEHFTSTDVDRLCNNAADADLDKKTKRHDIQKTGYKGLGFKAVFCISLKVTVLSKRYKFSFDKSHWEQPIFRQTSTSRYPWPIAPIWNESKANEVNEILAYFTQRDINAVSFLLQAVDRDCLAQEFYEIFNSLEILLSLRNVKKLTFNDINNRTTDYIEATNYNELTQLSGFIKGNTIQRSWYKMSFDIKTDKVREELQYLSSKVCPEKLKEARNVTITFAAQVKEKKIISSILSPTFYCYLPTRVNAKLPFLVNADFLLNQDRTDLLNNVWNQFLIRKIGKLQFRWFAKIVENNLYTMSILNLLARPEIANVHKKLNHSYFKGFKKGFENIPFVLSISGNLIKASECIIDLTGFFHRFYPNIIDKKLESKDRVSLIVSHKLEAVDFFTTWFENIIKHKSLMIKTFTFEHLLKNLESYVNGLVESNKYDNIASKLFNFFVEKWDEINDEQKEEIRKKLLFKSGNDLYSAEKCYRPYPRNAITNIKKKFPTLPLLNESLYKDTNIIEWLDKSLQMRSLTNLDVIRGYIFSLIKDNLIKQEDSVPLLRFIFSVYEKEPEIFNTIDIETLSEFPVFRKDKNLYPIKDCYFNVKTGGKFSNISKDVFIDLDRYYNIDGNEAHKDIWVEFIENLKIKTEIKLEFLSASYEEIEKKLVKLPQGKKLVAWLNDYYLACISPKGHCKTSYFDNFVYYDFLGMMEDALYYNLFWTAFEASYEKLSKHACSYKHNKFSRPEVMHYIFYVFNNHPITWTKNSTLLCKSSDLFLLDGIDDLLPVVDIRISLSESQRKLFGFKTKVEPSDCFNLLYNESKKATIEPKRLHKIYQLLLKSDNVESLQKSFMHWQNPEGTNTLLFLARDNRFRPLAQLSVEITNIGTIASSQIFNACELSQEEVEKLAIIFGLKKLEPQLKTNINILTKSLTKLTLEEEQTIADEEHRQPPNSPKASNNRLVNSPPQTPKRSPGHPKVWTPPPVTPEKQEKKQKIGRKGEEYLYQFLFNKYKAKEPAHENSQLQEKKVKEGIPGWSFWGKYKRGQKTVEITVKWKNGNLPFTSDSGKPYDISVKKIASNGKELPINKKTYIEVKSTEQALNTRFFMSENEYQFMHKNKNNYKICRVYGVGTKKGAEHKFYSQQEIENKLNFQPSKYTITVK